jgi:hypothetical protein
MSWKEETNMKWAHCLAMLGGMMVVAAVAAKAADAIDPVGKSFFTKCNIRFEHKDKIPSTNYHVGLMLAAGTKVKITACSKGRIQFTDEASGTAYTILQNTKHNPIELSKLFSQYFSPDNVLENNGLFNKFSRDERENMSKGTLAVGMSKEAALVAYGYPPNHRTPSTDFDTWLYWNSKIQTVEVRFADGKIKELVTGGPR